MSKRLVLTLSAVLFGLLSASAVHATPVTWTLKDVIFNDGTTASGSFIFDADTNSYVGFSITTSSGNTYGVVDPTSPGNSTFLSTLTDASPPDLTGIPNLTMEFAAPLTNAGGTVDILPGFLFSGGAGFSFESVCGTPTCSGFSIFRDVASGSVTTTAERIDNSTKGSALIYSKVDLRWGSDGRLLQDTILEITNDFPDDVYVQMYFINGDEPRDPIFALDPPVLVSEGEPGWNWVDCQTLLTANQPKYWSASSGSPLGCQPFTILDPGTGDGPGRLDPDSQDGGRVLRGYVLAWAVDAQGHPIRWNHLSGAATIVNYGAQAAWEYNAWAAQHGASSTNNNQVGGPGHLSFDGIVYDAGFDVLLMDFFASGSTALSGGGFMASSDTDLTLHPLSADLRQDSAGPLTTKAHFDIWNGNEQRFSGTHRCITCWDQTLLSRYDAPNHFLLGFLGTDRGKARIDGQRSTICDVNCVRAELDINGTDWGVCSYDASLIGVVAKILEFSGPVTGRRAMSGRSLVGAGRQNAQILYDIIAPPGELRDEAYEDLGGIQSDAPVRIGSPKKIAGRATVRH